MSTAFIVATAAFLAKEGRGALIHPVGKLCVFGLLHSDAGNGFLSWGGGGRADSDLDILIVIVYRK